MLPFHTFYERALRRKGAEALDERMPEVLPVDDLRALTDDRLLAAMAQCVFSAGFRWQVISAKWEGFEAAFAEFDPRIVAAFTASDAAGLATDRRIVRNPQKIRATIENAAFVCRLSDEFGGVGNFLADWPADDIIGLWSYFKQEGARLGGATGPRILRMVGRDTFILTGDVQQALTEAGVINGTATSKRSLKAIQEAFVAWQAESGLPFAHISVVLACSVDSASRT